MNQWVSQFIDYPQSAFLQFERDFVRHNKLVKGQMVFRGKVADLRGLHAALLVFAGRSDQIAPVAAVRALLDAVGSADKKFMLVPGGHMGIMAGATAPEHVWRPAADWLAVRSRSRQTARSTRTHVAPKTGRAPRRGAAEAFAASA
jgi:polyhydroxyalkanoate synthase